MKFVSSSTELLSHLQTVSRVIGSKNTLPILDCIHFNLSENRLTVTASDLETTMKSFLDLDNVDGEGVIAIPAKILIDILRGFSEQPLVFDINMDTFTVVISSSNGRFSIVGQNGDDFPTLPEMNEEEQMEVKISPEILISGISKAVFATAEDELRPVMNGILIELGEESVTFVASDAHKLVRYHRTDITPGSVKSFILPKKPANLLKNILGKEAEDVTLTFDNKNAVFLLSDYKLVCRLVEGTYPNYSSVIPKNNPNKLTIDRLDFCNSLKRVSVFANQATNLVKLDLANGELTISAQDIDFSISATERLNCIYDGDPITIGFKSLFLIEILTNLPSSDVVMELSDPSRAGLLLPSQTDHEGEDILMLIMPMMINA